MLGLPEYAMNIFAVLGIIFLILVVGIIILIIWFVWGLEKVSKLEHEMDDIYGTGK